MKNEKNTWGFYCDACRKFFDLVRDRRVMTHEGNTCTRYHSCGAEARYIGYERETAIDTEKYNLHRKAQSIAHKHGFSPNDENFAKCVGAILEALADWSNK